MDKWNKGIKTGFVSKTPEKTRKKLREMRKGKKHTEGTKKKIGKSHKGKKHYNWKKPAWNRGKSGLKKEKNPAWKGGKVELSKLIRNCFQYRQWRSDVFTRDDFTCQKCSEKGCRLEADHYPKSFFYLLDKYKIKSLEEAYNYEELWNINNGRTLCKGCHKKTKTYGRKKKS